MRRDEENVFGKILKFCWALGENTTIASSVRHTKIIPSPLRKIFDNFRRYGISEGFPPSGFQKGTRSTLFLQTGVDSTPAAKPSRNKAIAISPSSLSFSASVTTNNAIKGAARTVASFSSKTSQLQESPHTGAWWQLFSLSFFCWAGVCWTWGQPNTTDGAFPINFKKLAPGLDYNLFGCG